MILSTVLAENAYLRGAQPAILDLEATYTWAQFADRVARGAAVLNQLGLRRGGRYATLMRNSYRQAELLWAGYWSGIVPVPINWRSSAAEIAAVLEDAECGLVAAEAEFLPLLDAPALAAWRRRVLVVESRGGGRADFEDRLAAAAPVPAASLQETDDAILLYTGGTTGRSKGVRLSHGNVLANAWQIGLAIRIRPDDVYSHVAPMFHAADLHGTIAFVLGCRHVYMPQFVPGEVAAAIERHRVSLAHWVPTMVKMFTESPDTAKHDLSSLRLLFYGSSPMPVEWMRAARDRFPRVEIFQGYGLTETAPILAILDDAAHARCFETGDTSLLRSAGRPVAGLELRIVDASGLPVPTGQTGEVTVRGPNVSRGYLKRDEDNARAFRNGWFHTGDVGRLDPEGHLFLVDRMKDMIITGGENVYSTEVEAVLHRHPDIGEAAVIGVPDDKLGEALFAVIAPRPGAVLTAEDVIRHCREFIGGYKIPRRMAFVDALPRTAVGKVQKTVLRELYARADRAGEQR